MQGFDPGDYSQAIEATEHLGAASMASYTSNNRVTRWISHNILEEPKWEKDSSYVRNSYVYNWRAFSNTRNSSKNNAVELGDRTWNKKNEKFGNRSVKKNGQFDFEPRKYGYDNLLTIQKDNQNTVTVSTENKIGLSNTNKFFV